MKRVKISEGGKEGGRKKEERNKGRKVEERQEMRRVSDGPGPHIELSAGSLEVMKYTLPNWSRSWL